MSAADLVKQRWIPVTERLPEDSRMVLAYVAFRGDRHIARYVDKPNWGWMRRDYYKLEKVTHWQSLPPSPLKDITG